MNYYGRQIASNQYNAEETVDFSYTILLYGTVDVLSLHVVKYLDNRNVLRKSDATFVELILHNLCHMDIAQAEKNLNMQLLRNSIEHL